MRKANEKKNSEEVLLDPGGSRALFFHVRRAVFYANITVMTILPSKFSDMFVFAQY